MFCRTGNQSRENTGGIKRMMIFSKPRETAFSAQKYERAVKSLIACTILFLAIHTAGIEIEIAPCILLLTATAFSMGIMWQTLNSSGKCRPYDRAVYAAISEQEMTFSLVLAFTSYTLITKTFLVLALFFAVHEWSVLQIAVSLLCACNSCFSAAAWYTMKKRKSFCLFSFYGVEQFSRQYSLCGKR